MNRFVRNPSMRTTDRLRANKRYSAEMRNSTAQREARRTRLLQACVWLRGHLPTLALAGGNLVVLSVWLLEMEGNPGKRRVTTSWGNGVTFTLGTALCGLGLLLVLPFVPTVVKWCAKKDVFNFVRDDDEDGLSNFGRKAHEKLATTNTRRPTMLGSTANLDALAGSSRNLCPNAQNLGHGAASARFGAPPRDSRGDPNSGRSEPASAQKRDRDRDRVSWMAQSGALPSVKRLSSVTEGTCCDSMSQSAPPGTPKRARSPSPEEHESMFEETIKKAGQLPTTIVGALLGLVGSAQEPLSVAWFLRLSARFVLVVVYFIYVTVAQRAACFIGVHQASDGFIDGDGDGNDDLVRAAWRAAAWRKSAHCDAWETAQVPAWLYSLETTMLWCVSFQYTLLALSVRRPFAYLGSLDHFFELPALPIAMRLWAELKRAINGGPLPVLPELAMQLGFLHLVQLVRLHGLGDLLNLLFPSRVQAKLVKTALNLSSFIICISGLLFFMFGGALLECGPLPDAILTLYEGEFPKYSPVGALRQAQANGTVDATIGSADDDGCGAATLQNFFDFVYFAVVTISTVGYGDWSPPTPFSRAVVAVFIVLVLCFIPPQLNKVVELIQHKNSFGKMPRSFGGAELVVVLGPVSPYQLAAFAHEFFCLRETVERRTHIIVLSPLPLGPYRAMLKSAVPHAHRSRLYVQQGDVLSNRMNANDTNQLLSILNRAKGFFVIGNTDGYVTDEHGDAAELLHARRAAVEADDRATLIRCLVLSKLLTPRRMPAVSVQLGTCAAKRLALGLRAKAVVALSELKSAILAQACTRCFGLPTLLSNMVYAEHNAGTTAASRQFWESEYLFGMSHEVYQSSLPKCAEGWAWRDLVGVVYQELHIILLGRLIRRSSLTGKKGRSKSEAGAALLDSERVSLDDLDSREEMMTLSMDPRSSAPVEPGCVVLALACSQQHACLIETLDSLPQFKPKPAPEKVRAAWQNHSDRERQRFADRRRNRLRWARAAERLAPPPTPPQGTKVLYDATDRVEKDVHHRRFVLAVAARWPDQLKAFVSVAVGSADYAVVILCAEAPPAEEVEMLANFTDDDGLPLAVALVGDPLSSRQLVRAGLRDARSVCVLSTAVGAHLEQQDDTAFGQLASAKADEASVMLSTAIRAVLRDGGLSTPLVTELKYAQSTRFLDPTPWWPRRQAEEFAYVQAPVYLSGHCLAESMLYPILGYTYFLPQLVPLFQGLIDTGEHAPLDDDDGATATFARDAAAAGAGGGSGLSGTGIPGKSGLGGVADEATKAASGHGTDMGLDRLQLWLIPRSFVKEGVIFQDLFNALLAEGLLALGLLRAPHEHAPYPYVYTCPLPKTVIRSSDRVYVRVPCTAGISEDVAPSSALSLPWEIAVHGVASRLGRQKTRTRTRARSCSRAAAATAAGSSKALWQRAHAAAMAPGAAAAAADIELEAPAPGDGDRPPSPQRSQSARYRSRYSSLHSTLATDVDSTPEEVALSTQLSGDSGGTSTPRGSFDGGWAAAAAAASREMATCCGGGDRASRRHSLSSLAAAIAEGNEMPTEMIDTTGDGRADSVAPDAFEVARASMGGLEESERRSSL